MPLLPLFSCVTLGDLLNASVLGVLIYNKRVINHEFTGSQGGSDPRLYQECLAHSGAREAWVAAFVHSFNEHCAGELDLTYTRTAREQPRVKESTRRPWSPGEACSQ